MALRKFCVDAFNALQHLVCWKLALKSFMYHNIGIKRPKIILTFHHKGILLYF